MSRPIRCKDATDSTFPRLNRDDFSYNPNFSLQLKQVVVSHEFADELLYLLEAERITLARLQPTFANVTKTLENSFKIHSPCSSTGP
jgi:hypothetical protein